MLILLGAMGNEISGLKKKMAIEDTLIEGNSRIYKGRYGNKEILLGQTGIGKDNAMRCVDFLLERYSSTALISIGFSGALVEDLKVGDVVLGKTLYSGDDCAEKQTTIYSDDSLISMALESQDETNELLQVSSVTTTNPVGNPGEKPALGRAFSAEMVDMESYWIGRTASDRNVPFLSIRAISDTVSDTLPPFDRFLVNGKWQIRKAILYFLTHPRELAKLLYLYRNTRRAERNLTAFVDSFITRYEAN